MNKPEFRSSINLIYLFYFHALPSFPYPRIGSHHWTQSGLENPIVVDVCQNVVIKLCFKAPVTWKETNLTFFFKATAFGYHNRSYAENFPKQEIWDNI